MMSAINRTERIGDCTLYLADCRDVFPLLKSNSFDLLLTDPPYGVAWKASTSRRKDPFGVMKLDGKDDRTEVHAILCASINKIKPHRHSYIFGEWGAFDFPLGGRCELIWDKMNTTLSGADTPWAKQHEEIWFGVKANAAQRAMNDGLRAARLRRGSVLRYQRTSGAAVKNHPTEKPVPLLRELIESSSRIGDTVFDPFMGSGSAGVAAVLEGRSFVGIEVDEGYFNRAVERIRQVAQNASVLQTRSAS